LFFSASSCAFRRAFLDIVLFSLVLTSKCF
jgi:hypothetical protein